MLWAQVYLETAGDDPPKDYKYLSVCQDGNAHGLSRKKTKNLAGLFSHHEVSHKECHIIWRKYHIFLLILCSELCRGVVTTNASLPLVVPSLQRFQLFVWKAIVSKHPHVERSRELCCHCRRISIVNKRRRKPGRDNNGGARLP